MSIPPNPALWETPVCISSPKYRSHRWCGSLSGLPGVSRCGTEHGGLALSTARGIKGVVLHRDPCGGTAPRPTAALHPLSSPPAIPECRAAEGNQSTGLQGCLENISSSLPIICLKIPINVYTYVPGRHVYPQLMARRGSWRDLCAAAPARSQPALIYSFSRTGSF